MNKDLEETLEELGPEYRLVVAKLKSAFEVDNAHLDSLSTRRPFWRKSAFLIAASVMIVFAFSIAMLPSPNKAWHDAIAISSVNSPYMLAYCGQNAVERLVDTQNADGSWQSDYLTMQNAAALRNVKSAQIAYRKALRYLRLKGLDALSDREFVERMARASVRRKNA